MDVFNAIIGIIGTILGGILSYAAFHSSSKKDNKNEGKETGTILTEIGYIKPIRKKSRPSKKNSAGRTSSLFPASPPSKARPKAHISGSTGSRAASRTRTRRTVGHKRPKIC